MAESVWNLVYDYFDDLYLAGNDELANKLNNFSSLAYAKDQEAVEALYPELVAFAKSSDHKWLEIYLRHWRLQAYVNTNHDPRSLVPEVLDLLALTSNEDTKTCPQSTCVIDDITDIYAAIDAKGFAQERRDMLVETLDGLSVQVECYQCMTMSLVNALVDLDKHEEALDVFDKAALASPDMVSEGHFYNYLAPMVGKAMIGAGRYEKAYDLLEKCEPRGADGLIEVLCLKTQLANLQNELKAAEGFLNTILNSDIKDIGTEQFVLAVKSFGDNLPNTNKVLSLTLLLSERCSDLGRVREAFDAAALAFYLGKRRKDEVICARALVLMETVNDHLNRPLGATEILESARS